MVQRLSPLDATFLELEQADRACHMHIGGVLIFESPNADSIPTRADVVRRLEPRLRRLDHFCERLSHTQVGGISWPRWIPESKLDLGAHISEVALPEPGSNDDLRRWAGEFYGRRLNRDRPLWEMAVVHGLEGGRWAIATKTHHSLVDGVGSVDLAHLLLEAEPDAVTDQHATLDKHPEGADVVDGPAETIRSLARIALAPARLGREALDLARRPERARRTLRRAQAAARLVIEDELSAAPRTSINGPIGPERRLEVANVPIEDARTIGRKLGGTINDVVLAAATGGLRRLLISREEIPPERGLRAMVPVNLRQASEKLEIGNRISSLFVRLPVAIGDRGARYTAQLEEAESLKSSDQALGSSTIADLAGLAPPALHSFLARSLFATRLFNVTITNVPGPQATLYSLGSPLREVWPIVPLAADHGLALAVFSYDGRLFFCVNADPSSIPDAEVVREGIEREIAALSELAASRGNGSEQPVFGGVVAAGSDDGQIVTESAVSESAISLRPEA